jgi:tight adherence protein C
MIILLIGGLGCLALFGYQLTRGRFAADRDRNAALETVRAATDGSEGREDVRRSVLLARVPGYLARIHTRIWRKESEHDITLKLLRAGTSRRLTAEFFMAGRVLLTALGLLAGFTFAHGAGRILLAIAFAAAGIYLPGFLLSKAAGRRTERINSELPHFVDQLAIAIEAGMSFDAALRYLVDASEGPLEDEMRRVLTELRVGASRATAIRSFAERVGSDEATTFANAVISSEQLGSPLAAILHSQGADLRHRRQTYAEERAQKAPVKMLFPMVIFILPVMFLIILAPAFLGDHSIL